MNEEINRKSENTLRQVKIKSNFPKSIGIPKSVLTVKFIEAQAYLRNEKNLKKTQNLLLKKIRKRGTNKAQSQNRQQQQK